MIRKIIIVALTLGTLGTCLLWVDSYRGRVPWKGTVFHGWCMDQELGDDTGIHTTVRVGGICLSYRFLLAASAAGGRRTSFLTRNTGYCFREDYKRCSVNAEHRSIAPSGMRLVVNSICLPLWLFAVSFGSYPAIAFIRDPFRSYRRRKRGLCVTCGYDLRGSPERCPECATEIESL